MVTEKRSFPIPKYKIGDTVWFLEDKKVSCDQIVSMKVSGDEKKPKELCISYGFEIKEYYEQSRASDKEIFLFPTKEELIASL